ncbi:MAG: ABC transporter ATP-binding protein [Gemmatimonadetes bacterium]|nr:ABC transporter ATP-binding protein [Gemmatimonadota bacterium]
MTAATTGTGDLAIRIRAVDKWFGAVHANRAADLEVVRNEINALVGENGAGKSTLMKIVSGLQPPDRGTIEVNGRDVTGWSTAEAIRAGVGMVHQHFMLVPTLSVAENVVLGREPGGRAMFDRAQAIRDVESLVASSGLAVDANRLVADLSVGEAQRVEILKTLYRGARILLLDEPTAVLSPPEVADLWRVLRRVRDQGTTIVLITHKLDEIMAVTDRITVMRQGATVARMVTKESTPEGVARAMVGRDVSLAVQSSAAQVSADTAPALEIRNLTVRGARVARAVNEVSLAVRPGEILGIAGVEGNGQSELLDAIVGFRAAEGGSLRLGGADLTRASVRARADAGLAHIPEDRHHRGLILDYSIAENLILGLQHRFSTGAQLDRAKIRANAEQQVRAFDIRPTDPALAVRGLSGGNQQKVVIARELSREFSVLVAAQPTRGVDVGAIEFIHDALRKARNAGKAILLVSAELREILTLSDRIAVMYGGRIVTEFARADATEEVLGPFMTGARRDGAAA